MLAPESEFVNTKKIDSRYGTKYIEPSNIKAEIGGGGEVSGTPFERDVLSTSICQMSTRGGEVGGAFARNTPKVAS